MDTKNTDIDIEKEKDIDIDNDIDIDIDTDIDNKNKNKRVCESKRKVATGVAKHTPTLNDILNYGNELNVDEKYCKKFFNTYSAIDWKTSSGVKITNWKAKFEQWVEEDNLKNSQQEEKEYL